MAMLKRYRAKVQIELSVEVELDGCGDFEEARKEIEEIVKEDYGAYELATVDAVYRDIEIKVGELVAFDSDKP